MVNDLVFNKLEFGYENGTNRKEVISLIGEPDFIDNCGGEYETYYVKEKIGMIDPNGYMNIVDRAKDVIKSGGEWISSIDLENAAIGHPSIAECAVIGVPHPKWDERPLLLAIAKEGVEVSKQDILDYLSDKVVKWWLPDDVIFVTELPHTATGKLLKMKLREIYQEALSNQ